MGKDEIKKILEKHLCMLSNIEEKDLKNNPILIFVVTEAIKTTTLTLKLFI